MWNTFSKHLRVFPASVLVSEKHAGRQIACAKIALLLCACCPDMDLSRLQDIFPPHLQCSQEKLRIHLNIIICHNQKNSADWRWMNKYEIMNALVTSKSQYLKITAVKEKKKHYSPLTCFIGLERAKNLGFIVNTVCTNIACTFCWQENSRMIKQQTVTHAHNLRNTHIQYTLTPHTL